MNSKYQQNPISASDRFTLCILRLSAIGDVCHAVAMVTAILAQKPNVDITWVIGKVEYQLLKHLPNIRFVVYDKNAGKKAQNAVKTQLANAEFDALFVMQVALRANWLSRVIRAKKRIGFDKARSKEGHSLFINSRIKAQKFPHVLEGFMGFAETIGIDITAVLGQQVKWDFPLLEKDQQWLTEQLQQAQINKFAVISPAASKAERNWLPERYAAIADHLYQKGLKVVLCGGPGKLDRDVSQAILSFTDNIALNLVAKTSLTQMLSVLNRAAIVIAPDTGPAHMASTQNTPVVGLYAHSNPRRTGPYLCLDFVVSVYEELALEQFGKPWQSLPWGKRVKGDALMHRISVEAVIKKIDTIL